VQPHAATLRLPGEPDIEDLVPVPGVDPGSRVRDPERVPGRVELDSALKPLV